MNLTEAEKRILRGHRTSWWGATLLDSNDQPVRPLDEFVGGSIEQNRFRAIRGGGTLQLATTMSDESAFDIDWGSMRFRIEQHIEGFANPLPWGVYLPEVPEFQYDDDKGVLSCSVKLMDKLAIFAQDAPTSTYTVPAGANIINTVRNIITARGETAISYEPSSLTLPAPRVYPITDDDTTWLSVINDLLSIAGYFSLWSDPEGVLQVSPWRPAGESDLAAWTFQYGASEGSLYLAEWTREEDWFEVPNQVTLVSEGGSDAPALVATAQNNDLRSKFSIPRRGRVIAVRESGVQAASQATLQTLANSRLNSLTTAVVNYEVTTAPLPLWPNDRVDFLPANSGGMPITCTVSSWTMPLTPNALMDQTWREVAG